MSAWKLVCLGILLVYGPVVPVWAANAADTKVSNVVTTDKMRGVMDEEGFIPIFNGKDLTGWDGDPRLWSVREGVICGQTTPEKPAIHNTFLIWRNGILRDFVLEFEFRVRGGNSGVHYRSQELKDWIVSGYQGEIANDRPDPGIGSGFLHQEQPRKDQKQRWRNEVAFIGEFVVIDESGKRTVVGEVGDANALKAAGYYKNEGWNEYTIYAHGNHLIHWINGYQTIEVIDNEVIERATDGLIIKGGAREGILAFQIHLGGNMLVEFKDVRLKQLDADLGPDGRKFNDKYQAGWIGAPNPHPPL